MGVDASEPDLLPLSPAFSSGGDGGGGRLFKSASSNSTCSAEANDHESTIQLLFIASEGRREAGEEGKTRGAMEKERE